MSNRYRAAKKFKLDDDFEVTDKFSGPRKNHVKRNWDDSDRRRASALWRSWRMLPRYLNSRVGDAWDEVYSDICRIANHSKDQVRRMILQRVKWNVELQTNIIDGEVCDDFGRCRRWGGTPQPFAAGDLYVHNGILCVGTRKNKKYKRKPKVDETVVHYKLDEIKYQRKVGCGMMKEVVDKVWIKITPYENIRIGATWTRDGSGEWHKSYHEVVETLYNRTTASKKEIRDNQLNKEKQDD